MMEKRKYSAREAAYISLAACEKDKKYSNLEIDSAIRRFKLEGAEKGLYTTLVYGVIECRITLDYVIGKLSSKPIETLDAPVLTLLRLGLYQIIKLDRVPDSAAVNETVELAKRLAPRAASFINAVLRGFLRTYKKDALPCPDSSDMRAYLSVKYSVGCDVLDVLTSSVADTEAMLAALSNKPDVTLRVNTLKAERSDVLTLLRGKGVDAVPTVYSPFGIRITKKSLTPEISELISSGYVYIQDEASQIAVICASPTPGSTVIDSCACPGGKSFGAAMMMENQGRLMSFDLHKNKLSLISSGAEKLGITIIETAEKNGSVRDDTLVECADTVICDVPCSGFGVMAKKPEIRYKSKAEFARLPEIQYSIIKNVSAYVKHGGTLLYSTCTVNREENEAVVERFLAESTEFALEGFTVGDIASEGMLTLYPHIHATDGFFVAHLRRA